ncbi:hypothetical protein ACVIW2_008488 [Bradyrhizobium huanghuaihaiense]|uniref:Uncharacterized protein n=1 Tax=Bradyrhizobium huanghuaihaiense TaxID=990078 RepID=A0A562QWN0_9BRAD|nr:MULTISPECIES: hypothetical protein [Bradyrhizobium]TWI61258.1 hypothetical protein IQ16_07136 [Bradyrhizobium huanghuaihaiense]UWU79643.1 hypothetical protein N2603_14620 [Bradyrhizobium sp. CB3035]
MLTRRRFKQTRTLDQRLAEEAARLRDEARALPAGHKREMLLRKARQDETAVQIEAWLRSPGLRAPT